MATTMQCDIVSAEREIFSGRVTMVIATGSIGELGILPGHAPLLTGIEPGPVTLRLEDGGEDVFFASGGFLEVQPGIVTVLADTALRAEDIDEAAAIEVKESGRAQPVGTGRRLRLFPCNGAVGRRRGSTAHAGRTEETSALTLRQGGRT